MATFPSYAKISNSGYSESHATITARSEMDRGVPKQRKTQSDVMITVGMTLLFKSKQAAADFEDWYYDEAKAGGVFFDWTDPRTGVVRSARAVAGSLGPLQKMPTRESFGFTTRTLTIEYLRAL